MTILFQRVVACFRYCRKTGAVMSTQEELILTGTHQSEERFLQKTLSD